MTNTSKNKALILIIALLLITNISVLAYFMFNKHGHPEKGKTGFTTELKKAVDFDDDQMKQFSSLKETYWSGIKKNMDDIRQLKLKIFESSKDSTTPNTVIKALADSIGLLQTGIEINTYHHIIETRKICRPNQVAAYDNFIKKLINHTKGPKGKPEDKQTPPPKN